MHPIHFQSIPSASSNLHATFPAPNVAYFPANNTIDLSNGNTRWILNGDGIKSSRRIDERRLTIGRVYRGISNFIAAIFMHTAFTVRVPISFPRERSKVDPFSCGGSFSRPPWYLLAFSSYTFSRAHSENPFLQPRLPALILISTSFLREKNIENSIVPSHLFRPKGDRRDMPVFMVDARMKNSRLAVRGYICLLKGVYAELFRVKEVRKAVSHWGSRVHGFGKLARLP